MNSKRVNQSHDQSSTAFRRATVVDNRPCLNCGYNLKGLPVDGLCPECGQGIAGSLDGRLLSNGPGFVVRRVLVGAWVTLAGLAVMVGAMLAVVPISLAGLGMNVEVFWLLILGLAWLAGLMVTAAGLWVLSPPEACGPAQQDGARIVLRGSLGAQVILVVVLVASLMGGGDEALAWLALWLGVIALGTAYLSSLGYLQALAARIPSPALRAASIRLMWLGPAVAVMPVLLAAVLGTPGAPIDTPEAALVLMVWGGPAAAMVLYGWLIDRFRREMVRLTRGAG